MARIETKNYYTIDEVAEMFNRTESTIKMWIKYGDISVDDVLVYMGETYILKTAIDTFKDRIIA